MQTVVLTGVRQMELRDLPKPEIKGPTDVLLKVEMVGVCGSDVHYYETGRIGSQVVEFPFVVGHEFSATVIDSGGGVKHLKAGQKVAVDPAMACHNCDQCRAGRENTCRNLRFLGCPGQAEGCLCEYVVMPADCLYPIGEKVALSNAVLCEPLSIGIYTVRQSELSGNSKIAILGSGPIGLSVLVVAKSHQLQDIYVTEKVPERVEVAKKAGARWVGNPDNEDVVEAILGNISIGPDIVFECAGQQDTIDQAVELVRPGGKIMLVGIPREQRVSFIIDKLRRKEISVINVRRQNKCMQPAVDMVASEKVDVGFMITHRFKLEQAQQAFDMVAGYRDGVVKALIEL
jgi:L-iditol 2-dehydrogenase